MRVGVIGAGGRMGREVCRMVSSDPGLELVAAVDPELAGIDLRQVTGTDADGLQVEGHLEALTRAEAEVAVDFTHVDAARVSLAWCASAGIHAVVGTTGFSDGDMAALASQFAGPDQGAPNCVLAANFAIGAVLMMHFAEVWTWSMLNEQNIKKKKKKLLAREHDAATAAGSGLQLAGQPQDAHEGADHPDRDGQFEADRQRCRRPL